MFILYYFLICFSLIGYGAFFSKILKLNFENFGLLGLLGISFSITISYFSAIFFVHNYVFNSIFLLLGIISFIFYSKRISKFKQNIIYTFFVFSLMLIFVFVAKNHDDFGYYHFPYSYLLTQIEHPIGLGLLNNGFRNHSSIFFLNSLFYLPKISFYLLHIAPVYFLGFTNLVLFDFIRDKKLFEKFKFINFYSLMIITFINIFFYRLAEHGTDRSGMILIFLISLFALLIQNTNDKSKYKDLFYFICILSVLTFSLKPFYIIYLPLILIICILNYKKNLPKILLSRSVVFSVVFFLLVIFYNIINSGCLIFPLSISCYEDFSWSLNNEKIQSVNMWYELWSKAGASPNYIVENKLEYIKKLNWLPNWIDNYFFNKMSDFLLSISFVLLIFWLVFIFKQKKKFFEIKFLIIYLYFVLCIFEWFFKHPSLRYGGYHLIPILTFIPLSILFNNCDISFINFSKKAVIFLILITIIFLSRNINRLHNEFNLYSYNPLQNYKFIYDEKFYNRYLDIIIRDRQNYEYFNFFGKKLIIIRHIN